MLNQVPTIGEIGVKENSLEHQNRKLIGGETVGLEQLAGRIKAEQTVITGLDHSLRTKLDLFFDYSSSMSPALALGTISIRR